MEEIISMLWPLWLFLEIIAFFVGIRLVYMIGWRIPELLEQIEEHLKKGEVKEENEEK